MSHWKCIGNLCFHFHPSKIENSSTSFPLCPASRLAFSREWLELNASRCSQRAHLRFSDCVLHWRTSDWPRMSLGRTNESGQFSEIWSTWASIRRKPDFIQKGKLRLLAIGAAMDFAFSCLPLLKHTQMIAWLLAQYVCFKRFAVF